MSIAQKMAPVVETGARIESLLTGALSLLLSEAVGFAGGR
jgi:hypothetical protein